MGCFVSIAALALALPTVTPAQTYEKGTADDDEDAARLVAGLRVDGSDLVLNALEGKLLCLKIVSASCVPIQYDVFTPAFRDLGGVVF